MPPRLHVPVFPRLDEYVGVWAMEPLAFRALWELIGRSDLAAHMAEHATAPHRLESRVELVAGKGGRTVAMIPVTGTLMKQQSSFGGTSTVQLRRDIRQAAADPGVAAILLGIDSPGGTTAGLQDLATEVQNARKSKPVWAHVDDLAASAAYWVASQAEAIYANAPTALVGSIGTYLTIYDQSAAAEKEGIKALLFATGPIKGAGTPGTVVTEEQQTYFQGIVDGMQAEFDTAVRSGRKLSAAELQAVRTGAVWKAAEARTRKLIDGIQPLQKTIDQLAARAAGGAAPGPRAEAGTLPMLRRGLPMRTP
jgi:signal peptide peptidase SppA